jgi:DHA1 family bicyclomycin/chloramphenicol resistance-like MFS transporter
VSLGSLLVFVFAMPTVFVIALEGTINDFIIMQMLGISMFIVGANFSSSLVQRFGAESVIVWGSVLALAGCAGMLLYAVAGGREPWVIWMLFLPFNMGFGFRGPPSFYRALQASGGDDARASALLILYVMLMTAGGTALIAPFVERGLWPATLAATLLGAVSILLLRLAPPLPE